MVSVRAALTEGLCANKHQSRLLLLPSLKQDRTTTGSCGFGKQLQTAEHPV